MTESTVLVNDMVHTDRHGFVVAETADTLDCVNGHIVTAGLYRRLILAFHISASTNGDKLTITAGDNPPAFRAGIGSLTYTFVGGAKELVMNIDTSRFQNDDGFIHIASATHASLAGTIEAYGVE